MIFEGFDDVYDESARLAILRILAEQVDYRMNIGMVDDLLIQREAINRGRGYVRNQVAWLRDQARAVLTREEGGTVFVILTEAGADHVMRRHVLEGVKRQGPR
ncbi:MAG: hypothetical protein DI629_03510 [Mesorhizobium amorphae]|nr:MAG: hypothetical protein DI629_03510 [Mesorhizobium amorphae]